MYLNQCKVDTAPSRAGLLYGKMDPVQCGTRPPKYLPSTIATDLHRAYIGLTLFNLQPALNFFGSKFFVRLQPLVYKFGL